MLLKPSCWEGGEGDVIEGRGQKEKAEGERKGGEGWDRKEEEERKGEKGKGGRFHSHSSFQKLMPKGPAGQQVSQCQGPAVAKDGRA